MNNSILRKMKALTAGLVAAAILLLNLTPAYAAYYSDTAEDHQDLSFSQMQEQLDYSYEKTVTTIKSLTEAIKLTGNEEKVEILYRQMLEMLDDAVTANAFLNLEFYTHLDDESMSERLEKMSAELVELSDMSAAAIRDMVNGEYRKIVENDIGDAVKDYEDYEEMTEEEKALLAREDALETDYERDCQDSAYTGMARYKHLAEIYIDMVKVRKEIATHTDYATYREYVYESVYGRDYTAADADRYHQYVKDNVVPLYKAVVQVIISRLEEYQALWDKDCGNLDNIFAIMDKHLGEIDPELTVSYDYFKKHHMYYIENDENMYEAGYTTKLYSYDTPFIYNALYGSFYDYTDVFHEFGHFNQMFHSSAYAMYDEVSFDVAEIHSQGMELFFLDWAGECYGEELAEIACLFTMYRMLDNIISGSMQDEFQAEIFRLSDDQLYVDKLTGIYTNVITSYGRSTEEAYNWVEINHTFTSPFYYISYSTSAMGALQIYEMSKENRAEAVDCYMKLTALPGSMGYCEAVEKVGLKNIMAEGVVKDICTGLTNTIFNSNKGENPDNGNNNGGTQEQPDNGNQSEQKPDTGNQSNTDNKDDKGNGNNESSFGVYEVVRTVAVVLCCVCIIVCLVDRVRRSKKNAGKNNTDGNQ